MQMLEDIHQGETPASCISVHTLIQNEPYMDQIYLLDSDADT